MKNELELLKEIEYVRFGGTRQEYKTALWIIDRLAELGLKAHHEAFNVGASIISSHSLVADGEEIASRVLFGSPSVKDLKAPLYYFSHNDEVSLSEVKDKIVLVDRLGYWNYKDLFEHKALAVIVYNGDLYDDNRDIDQREIRAMEKEVGLMPVVQIHVKDAYRLIQDGVKEVCINIDSKDVEAESGNVICDIEGDSDKTLVFTAHYDSVWLSKGAYDNATGTIGLIKIAEYFAVHKPHHNIRFIFCGSEERGLLGSKDYVERHKDELKDIALCINLDMIGSTMGHFDACVSAEADLVSYLRYLACEEGVSLNLYHDVYSSDSTPFADSGVPAMSFARNTSVTPIHNRHDTSASLSLEHFKEDIAFIIAFAEKMANSKVFPVKREIPDSIKEKLDIYMCRKRK